MCGRYYIDDETAREIEKLVKTVDEKLHRKFQSKKSADIIPTEAAPVLTAEKDQKLCCTWKYWGFYQTDSRCKNTVMINRRSESVPDNPRFKELARRNRIVIPAAGFYEWNNSHEKNTFYSKKPGTLYMLGCYKEDICSDRFIIFTKEANQTVQKTHHRMPVLIRPGEIYDYLTNDGAFERYLQGSDVELVRKQPDYEQMSLF